MYLNFYQRMGILPLKKRVNRDKCSFATKQRMFGVLAIDQILRYRGTRFPGSRTLCHRGLQQKFKIETTPLHRLLALNFHVFRDGSILGILYPVGSVFSVTGTRRGRSGQGFTLLG